MPVPSDKFIRRLIWILLALAIFFIGTAFYIPAKAMLSQDSKPHVVSTVLRAQANNTTQDI